jgi:hypothetical protein
VFDLVYYFGGLDHYLILPDYLKSYNQEEVSLIVGIICLAISLPNYYALYLAAFDKNFFKKNN